MVAFSCELMSQKTRVVAPDGSCTGICVGEGEDGYFDGTEEGTRDVERH